MNVRLPGNGIEIARVLIARFKIHLKRLVQPAERNQDIAEIKPDRNRFRLKQQRMPQTFLRAAMVAIFRQRAGQIIVGAGIVRLVAYGLTETSDRVWQFAPRKENKSEIVMCLGIVRAHTQSGIEGPFRLVPATQAKERRAQADRCFRLAWINFERALMVCHGFCVPSEPLQRITEIVAGVRVSRTVTQDMQQAFCGFFPSFFVHQGLRKIVSCLDITWPDLERPPAAFDRAFEVAELCAHGTVQKPCLGIIAVVAAERIA